MRKEMSFDTKNKIMKGVRIMTLGKLTSIFLALLTSCTGAVTVSPTVTAEEITATDAAGTAYVCEFDDSDRTFSGYDEADCTSIVFANGSVSVSGGGAEAVSGGVKITKKGTYLITGSSDDGGITVDVESGRAKLLLGGVKLTKKDAPVINVISAKSVTVTSLDGTENTLSDSGNYAADESTDEDAVIYSKEDLIFNGKGSLTVTGTYNGIKSKDSLSVAEGTLTVTAENNGIVGKDFVDITGGTVNVTAKNNGIKATNTDEGLGYIRITGGDITVSADDAALNAENAVFVSDGTLDIVSGGGAENAPEHTENFGKGPGSFVGNRPNGERPGRGADEQPNGNIGTSSGGERPDSGSTSDNPPAPPEGNFGSRPNGDGGVPPSFPNGDGKGFPGGMVPNGNGQTEATDNTESTSGKGIKSQYISISGGSFTLDTADDAIHSNGSADITGGEFAIRSGDDAIHADETVTVSGGVIKIETCYEGIEGAVVAIDGGDIDITASDDAVNAASSEKAKDETGITIGGGKVVISAGSDGIDSNGYFNLSGGEVYISCRMTGGDGPIDHDGVFTVTGGLLLSTGGGTADSKGYTVADGMTCTNLSISDVPTGKAVSVKDSDGNVIASHTFDKSGSGIFLITSVLSEGDTFTVECGGEILSEAAATKTPASVGGFGGNGGTDFPGGGKGFGGQAG